MQEAAQIGVYQLYEWGALVILELLIIIGLVWFSKYLIKRNEELSDRLASLGERSIQAYIELKELIKNERDK